MHRVVRAQFERRHRRLELLAASVEEDIQAAARHNGADLQRLLPIQRCALTALQRTSIDVVLTFFMRNNFLGV